MEKRKELIEYRTPNSKSFLKEDGTIEQELYDEDIHYLKDGKYEEIDNTLVTTTNGYTNNKNDFKVEFSEEPKNLINVSYNENSLSMSFKNAESIVTEKKMMKKSRSTIKQSNIKDDIIYNGIYKDIDVKYEIRSNRLKESIILNKLPEQDTITFIFKTDLELKLNKNNTISCKSKRKERFIIEKPYMIDRNNNMSQDVIYSIAKIEEGYEITVTPDKKWLSDKLRAYPVIIDPTITSKKEDKRVIDTYIYEGDDKDTVYNTDILKIGKNIINGKEKNCQTLIKFELPKIPTSYSVVNAKLFLVGYPNEKYNEMIENPDMICVNQITQDWQEETAKWKKMNDKYNSKIENYFYSTPSMIRTDGKIEPKTSIVNITNLVQKWYAKEPNYGLMLRKMNVLNGSGDNGSSYFSNDNEVIGDNPKPRLIITYRDYNGLEGYLSYTSQSHELGSTYINNFNGNLTSTFNVANTIGGPMPASMYLVYNTADVIDEAKIDYGYGLGVKPNLIQTVEKVTIENIEMLKYLDEDGTNHYFYKKIIDDTKNPIVYSNEYYDEDGLGLKLELKDNYYLMTDKDSNTNKFVKHTFNNKEIFFLEEVKDTNNKTIKVVYDNNKISKVIDASNNEINITYETNKILFVSPHKTVVANYTDNKLTSIEDLGNTETISYNQYNLIERITNSNGLSTKYEYINNSPYKVSKVTEYSMNNEEGNYLEFTYNFKATKIKDRKGHIKTYAFNEYGNAESETINDSEEDIINSYAKTTEYGKPETKDVNKVLLDTNYVKAVNNIIDQASLESSTIEEIKELYTCSDNIELSIVSDAHYGNKALKAKSTEKNKYFYSKYAVKKDKSYTFSAYIKNSVPVKLSLSYDNTEEETIIKKLNDEYNRYEITINYPNNASSNLMIKFTLLEKGELIIDDLQLEEGEVANYFNHIYDGSYNYNREVTCQAVYITPTALLLGPGDTATKTRVSENCGAAKMNCIPYLRDSIKDECHIKGKKDDVFQYAFWYKNEGVAVSEEEENYFKSNIKVEFSFYNGDTQVGETIKDNLTYWNTDWHYFSKKYIAPADFTDIKVEIPVGGNVNDIYFTNFSLFKDLESYSYVYDDDGNLVSSVDLSKETSQFAYNSNNQLIQATTPKGANYKFEYDDNVTDRLIRAISPTGITNSIDYDINNNPIKTVVNNTGSFDDIINTIYYIRARGTDDYLYINADKTLRVKQCECSHDKFNILKQSNGQIKLQYSIMPNYYLKDNNRALKIEYGDNNNLFELIKHSNKSYSIKSTYSNLAVTVNSDKSLSLTTYNESNANQQFLFERMESSLFIESSAKYTDDGRFIKSVKDSVGNITSYDINPINGLTNSITDAKGNTTNYFYDSKFRPIEITSGNHKVEYEYNSKDNLSKVIHGTKNYTFSYDEFNRRTQTKINDRLLSESFYEPNNGNLTKMKYGNNCELKYIYDLYERTKTICKRDNSYTNYYDNLGRVSRITSNDEIYNYEYDFAGRLSTFKYNNYSTIYDYDKDNTILKKIEELGINKYTYNYTYNKESSLTNINILNNNFNYVYDKLGRLTENNINGIYKTTYNYITRGNKTSSVINKVNDNGTEYSYIYDSLGNIDEIKKNNILTNKYYYDDQSQLIKEDDLVNQLTKEYTYDNYGNILTKKTYTYNTTTLVKEDTYEYSDSSWQDLLTKFNNEPITYDEIGNPLTIGNKTLTWINGRELSTYSDGTNNISYKYNLNGIRTSKTVNGIKTNYILEGNSIIFEDRNGTMIYYIYSGNDLLGFVYQNQTYYYHKNIFGDIIGILDSNYNEIVTYEYDSWGTPTKVTDNSTINLGTINPFRYRGYYYDEETNLYYLNARYYNPQVGRFINADSIITGQGFIGNNLFAYCNNSDINKKDIDGHFVITLTAGAIATTLVVSSLLSGMAISFLAASSWQVTANIMDGKENVYENSGCAGAIAAIGFATSFFIQGALGVVVGSFVVNELSVMTGLTNQYDIVSNTIWDCVLSGLPGGNKVLDFVNSYGASIIEENLKPPRLTEERLTEIVEKNKVSINITTKNRNTSNNNNNVNINSNNRPYMNSPFYVGPKMAPPQPPHIFTSAYDMWVYNHTQRICLVK